MVILIPDNCPAVASAAYWREVLNCSRSTLERAERSGALVPTGSNAHKLYSKSAIFRWLHITDK